MLELSPKASGYKARLEAFMDEHMYPNEARFFRESDEQGAWGVQPVIEELKPKAKAAGLWTLFMPDPEHGPGLHPPQAPRLAPQRLHQVAQHGHVDVGVVGVQPSRKQVLLLVRGAVDHVRHLRE